MRPIVEDLALRIRERAEAHLPPLWRDKRVMAAGLIVAVSLIVAGVASLRGDSPARFRPTPPAKAASAVASVQEKLKANPQDIDALVELGLLHFSMGKDHYADGINELEEARDLGALDPRIFYALGLMYQEVGLYSFALEEYRRYLRHYPDDKDIRLLAAKLLYKQASFREAVAEYERLKYRHPGDSLIEENLALSLWGAKDLDRAIDSFNQLRGMGQEQARRAEFYLGQIAFDRGDFKAALEHLTKAEGQPPAPLPGIPEERLQSVLAQTHTKLGQFAEAKAAWEKVVAANPDDSKAKQALRDVARRIPAAKKKN